MLRIFAFGVSLSLLACGGTPPDGQGGLNPDGVFEDVNPKVTCP
jgi:hypothetical protein